MVLLKEFSLILFLSRLANFAKTITNIGTTLGYTNVSNYHYWPECGSLFLRSYDANFSQCRTSKSRDRCGLANTRPDCVPFSSWAQTNNPASGTMNGALCHPLPDCLIDHTTCRSLDRSQSNKSKIPKKLLVNVCPLERIDAMRTFCLPWQLIFQYTFPFIWNPFAKQEGRAAGLPPHTFGIHRLTSPPHVDKATLAPAPAPAPSNHSVDSLRSG